MTEVSFAIGQRDFALVCKIAQRAHAVRQGYAARGTPPVPSIRHTQMDLTAVHANGCPMDFRRLYEADDFNLLHDVVGIERHLDRETGKLGDCFLPRCAKKEQRAAWA